MAMSKASTGEETPQQGRKRKQTSLGPVEVAASVPLPQNTPDKAEGKKVKTESKLNDLNIPYELPGDANAEVEADGQAKAGADVELRNEFENPNKMSSWERLQKDQFR